MSGCKSGTGLQQLLLLSSDGNLRRLIWVYNYDSRSDESVTDIVENCYSECTFLLPEYISPGQSEWYHIQSSIETLDKWISISIPVSSFPYSCSDCVLFTSITFLSVGISGVWSLESWYLNHPPVHVHVHIHISNPSSHLSGCIKKLGTDVLPFTWHSGDQND
jgi:hypothetical protein